MRQQPLVTKLNYAGLSDFPGHDVHTSQATSAGSLFSFTTGDEAVSKIICENAKLFKITVSFGNVRCVTVVVLMLPDCIDCIDCIDTLPVHATLTLASIAAQSARSLISMPCFLSHASIPAEVRAAR